MSEIIRNISCIFRCGARYRTAKLEPLGLNSRQGNYLLEICNEPGISQDALARRISVNKSNVTRQVSALEEEGWLDRRPCGKDKRVMRLYPTQKALDVAPQIQSIADDWGRELAAELESGEQEQLASLLARLGARASALAGEE